MVGLGSYRLASRTVHVYFIILLRHQRCEFSDDYHFSTSIDEFVWPNNEILVAAWFLLSQCIDLGKYVYFFNEN